MISPLSSKATARYFYQQLQKYPKEPQAFQLFMTSLSKEHNATDTRFALKVLRKSCAFDIHSSGAYRAWEAAIVF